jgi:hypothetical protein
MLTAYLPVRWRAGTIRRPRSKATRTSGGRNDTELNELTVVPHGRSPSQVVITATPVAKRRKTVRNVSASKSATASV